MKLAYADPPYPGCAHLYRSHPDFAGEVDHAELLERLAAYDGWALSTSIKGLREVLPLCPPEVLVHAWVKTVAPPMGDHRIYSWEPVLVKAARNPQEATRMSLVCAPPMFTFRGTPAGHVIGEKPPAFCRWVFATMGARAGEDSLADLYPGSGAVAEEWDAWAGQGQLT